MLSDIDVLLLKENFLNSFGVGIRLGKKREGCQDHGIQSIRDIHRYHVLTPSGIWSGQPTVYNLERPLTVSSFIDVNLPPILPIQGQVWGVDELLRLPGTVTYAQPVYGKERSCDHP